MITFTNAAVNHIKNHLAKVNNSVGFRLSIKKTGCSGYQYVHTIIDEVIPNDLHFTIQEGLSIYIDPACENFIKGMVVDYISDTKMGLKQKRLVFINSNEESRCGCGESFTVKESNHA